MTGSSATADPAQAHGHGAHGHGDHPEHLAHHFDTENQQFDAGKLGIWVFLVTEILFFSGLFCAYAIWRTNHPEVFLYAHHYLSTFWGTFNTVVLLFSSLTAAWAVRCAQLGQKQGLIVCLVLTIVCAFGFMGVKYVEYTEKIQKGLVWGKAYAPVNPYIVDIDDRGRFIPLGYAADVAKERGMPVDTPEAKAESIAELVAQYPNEPEGVRQFFSIYFAMTGLHGIHVLGGILVFLWLLRRAIRGEFGPKYFGPIDYAALYWHLVDLVWIYLFPMLYLIH